MIRLTDLVLITFGVVECGHKLFYYSNLDQLYITRPCEHRIDCISNIYHEIVAVRSDAVGASTMFMDRIAANSNFTNPLRENSDSEIKENNEMGSSRTLNSGTNALSSSVEPSNSMSSMNLSRSLSLLKVAAVGRSQSEPTTSTKLKHGNDRKLKDRNKRRESKRKMLSNEDVKALMQHHHHDRDGQDVRNGIGSNHSAKKICFPKSLYLVYTKRNKNRSDLNEENVNENDSMMDNIEDIEMEILCELDNMLQSYMLSELRLHSKRLLGYTKRNYSFLYLYTSPYDGQSMYRELDGNYESSVPAKNLIQHSSIGPVILVQLKRPTKEQVQKQKEREARRLKRKRQRLKSKKNHPT